MSIYSIEEISRRIVPVAERYGVEKVTLFGSYARGDAVAESDIDLMISYKKLKGAFALGGVFADFKEVMDKSVDVVSEKSLTAEYTSETSKKLYDNIKREGIVIYKK